MTLFREHRGKVTRVVDGDTLDIEVDLSFRITTHQRFRLQYIDTPERGDKKFKEATELLERLIEEQTTDGYFYFDSVKTGKYGRWLLVSRPLTSILAVQYPYGEKMTGAMKRLRKAMRKGKAAELIDYEHIYEKDYYDKILEDIAEYGEEYFLERFIL